MTANQSRNPLSTAHSNVSSEVLPRVFAVSRDSLGSYPTQEIHAESSHELAHSSQKYRTNEALDG